MSSLAASRADGYYFPPDWRPEFGGISKFQGSKGANQYEKYGIIRFELPFDAWCLKCGTHMSKGLRFNAKKDKDGKFFTTQIWKFTMKCYSCEEQFVIKTDPEHDTYDYVEGLRKHEQDYEPDLNESHIKVSTDEERRLLASDAMYRLQHEREDKVRTQSARERLESLIELQTTQTRNDFDANSALRRANREKRKRAGTLLEEGRARGLSIPLVEPNEKDARTAKDIMSRVRRITQKGFATDERKRMVAVQSESIFSHQQRAPSQSSAVNTKKLLKRPDTAHSTGNIATSSSSTAITALAKSGADASSSSTTVRAELSITESRRTSTYTDCNSKETANAYSQQQLSSEAKKLKNTQEAMKKQAFLNINTKRLKLCEPSVSNLTGDSANVKARSTTTAVSTTNIVSVPRSKPPLQMASSEDKNVTETVFSSRDSILSPDRAVRPSSGVTAGALQLIASYSDNDDDD